MLGLLAELFSVPHCLPSLPIPFSYGFLTHQISPCLSFVYLSLVISLLFIVGLLRSVLPVTFSVGYANKNRFLTNDRKAPQIRPGLLHGVNGVVYNTSRVLNPGWPCRGLFHTGFYYTQYILVEYRVYMNRQN